MKTRYIFLMLVVVLGAMRLSAQPGATCATAVVIPSLPFSQTGLTTCGNGNTYTSAHACGSIYMDGDDYLFRYMSPGNERIAISLSNTDLFTGVFLINGCPNAVGATCVLATTANSCTAGPSNESWLGNPYGAWDICNAGTYYILVSTWPSPQCTPFNISVTRLANVCTAVPAPALCYNRTTPAYNPDPFNSGTAVTFQDDEFSATTFPIGFNFCYNGTYYSQFVISSNGFITFNTNCAAQYSEYTTTPIPNPVQSDIAGSLLLNWSDLDPSVAGAIRYQNYGVAPNRRLSVSFRNVALFDCNAMRFFGQIVLYETSNSFAYFIQQHPICTTWNNGDAVQGITNLDGTQAMAVPGRNSTNWTATNDAQLFTPTCVPCLIVLPVTFRDFLGLAQQGRNNLAWETLSESNLSAFVVERSRDGSAFEEIGKVAAKGQGGSGAAYVFSDQHPASEMNYYRLRAEDLDGGENFSETIAISSNGAAFGIRSAVVDQLNHNLSLQVSLTAKQQRITFEIFDMAGHRLHSQYNTMTQGLHETSLDVAGLPSGIYFVSVSDGNGSTSTRKFVIY